MNKTKAFILGLLEFRQPFTTNCGDYSYEYEQGRDFAHFLTFRVFNAWRPDSNPLSFKTFPAWTNNRPQHTTEREEVSTMTTGQNTEPKKKQDFSCYKQFPVRLNINKCLDIERIQKIAEMQGRGISFVDFVRNALDKYEMGGRL